MKPSFRQGEPTSPERPLLEEPIPCFRGLRRIEKAHRRGPNVRTDKIPHLSFLGARPDNRDFHELVAMGEDEIETDPVPTLFPPAEVFENDQ